MSGGAFNRALNGMGTFDAMTPKSSWESGTIQDVNLEAHTCSVYTDKGRLLSDLAWPDAGKPPRRGDRITAVLEQGRPLILPGSVDMRTQEPRVSKVVESGSFGGDDELYRKNNKSNISAVRGSPSDLMPGDQVLFTDEGSLVGAMAGGVAILRASELAQIVASSANQLVKIMGKNLELLSGAGHLKFKDTGGKTSLELRLGVDGEYESDPNMESWRIQLDLGADGDLLNFALTDGDGRSVYKLFVDPQGRVAQECLRKTEIVKEDVVSEVGTNLDVSVGGSTTVTASRGYTLVTYTTMTVQASDDISLSAGRDLSLVALRQLQVSSGAGLLSRVNGVTEFNSSNGDVTFNVSIPTEVGPTTPNNFNVNTLGGVIMKTGLAGASIGGPTPGIFNVMVHQMFSTFMTVFGVALDTHTHVSAAPGSPTTPPVVPIWNSTRALFEASKSNFLKTGG